MPIAQSIIPGVEAQPTILPIGSRIEPQAKSPKIILANLDIPLTLAPSETRFPGLSKRHQ